MIIGGGVFGLAAAHKLRNAGFHPVIIEARERLGGRVWTDENGFDLGGLMDSRSPTHRSLLTPSNEIPTAAE